MQSVIGALRIVLGMDSAAFEKGADEASKKMRRFGKDMQKLSGQMAGIGAVMTAGLTAPMVAFGMASVQAAKDAKAAMAQVEAALNSMGGASGRTAKQLKDAAQSFETELLIDADDILRQVTANMLTFGNVAGDNFDRAQRAVLDLSTRLGTDLQSATLLVGKALNDPVKGLTALSRSGIQFSASQKEVIKNLVATGKAAEAQSIILGELERQFGGSAKAAADANPWLKLHFAFEQLKDTIGEKLIPLLTPLVEGLTKLVKVFGDLSPRMQGVTLAIAGIGAAIGPLLLAVSAIISAIGTLGSALAAAGLSASVFGTALTALTGPVGLVIAGVAALTAGLVLLMHANSDAAIQADANRRAHERLDPIMGVVRESIDRAAVSSGELRKQHLAAADAALALGNAELESARKSVIAARARLAAAKRTDANLGLQAATGGMPGYNTGLAELEARRAEAELKAQEDILIKAGVAKRRGSRGRGTTLIPIDAESLAKQQTGLKRVGDEVEATGKAAAAATPKLETLSDKLAKLMGRDRIPGSERGQEAKVYFGLIDNLLESNVITLEQAAAAARAYHNALENKNLEPARIEAPADLQRQGAGVSVYGGRLMTDEQIAGLQRQMAGAFRGALQALRSEGVKGLFEWMADSFANRLLDRLADDLSRLFDQLLRSMQSTSGDGGWGQIISSVIGWFTQGSTGFATGGSFTVGGSGAADSKYVGLRLTPGEMVDIRRPGNDNATPMGLQVAVTPSPYFDVAVQRVAVPVATAAASAGYNRAMTDIPARMQRRSRTRIT